MKPPDPTLRRVVRLVALLNLGYFGVEFAVALAIGSVSLFADSVDFLEDASINFLIFAALGWTARNRVRVGMLLAGFLRLALPVPHARIEPAGGDKLRVLAALGDSALVEHYDLVGADDGREPMGDHERGAVLRHAIERVLNFLLGVAVERRGRLVEQ